MLQKYYVGDLVSTEFPTFPELGWVVHRFRIWKSCYWYYFKWNLCFSSEKDQLSCKKGDWFSHRIVKWLFIWVISWLEFTYENEDQPWRYRFSRRHRMERRHERKGPTFSVFLFFNGSCSFAFKGLGSVPWFTDSLAWSVKGSNLQEHAPSGFCCPHAGNTSSLSELAHHD